MTRFVPLAAACLCGWLALPTASAASPQQPTFPEPATKSAVVTSTTDAITLDGVLDEPIWRAAPTIGDLTQRQPEHGLPPTNRTDVTLLYDRDYLYVGVVAYDSEPHGDSKPGPVAENLAPIVITRDRGLSFLTRS